MNVIVLGKTIDVSDSHDAKACSDIVVTPSGIVIEVRLEQL